MTKAKNLAFVVGLCLLVVSAAALAQTPDTLATDYPSPKLGTCKLCLQVADMTPDAAKQLGIAYAPGAVVLSTTPGGPAAAAGLLPRDIITSFNGKDTPDGRTLTATISATTETDTIDVEVIRNGQRVTLETNLNTPTTQENTRVADGTATQDPAPLANNATGQIAPQATQTPPANTDDASQTAPATPDQSTPPSANAAPAQAAPAPAPSAANDSTPQNAPGNAAPAQDTPAAPTQTATPMNPTLAWVLNFIATTTFFGYNFFACWLGGTVLLTIVSLAAIKSSGSPSGRAALWRKLRHKYEFNVDTGEYQRIAKVRGADGGTLVELTPRDKRYVAESFELHAHKWYWLLAEYVLLVLMVMWFAEGVVMVRQGELLGGLLAFFTAMFALALASVTLLFVWQYATGRKYIVIDPPAKQWSPDDFGPQSVATANAATPSNDLTYKPHE